ncbi:MAG: hypothetical protein ACFFD9_07235 [Candidatus Thorarchaeota archaeon]
MEDDVGGGKVRCCEYCGKNELSRWWSGRKKYCSKECHAADMRHHYLAMTCMEGIVPVFGIVAIVRSTVEGTLTIDMSGLPLFLLGTLILVGLVYMTVLGYRTARRTARAETKPVY